MHDYLFFSVIIPTYNRRRALEQTVQCVFHQHYPRQCYELIVVDDGSTDGTVDYLRQLAREDKLRFISQRNAGPAAARNNGARIARGKILAFTDDDCQPEPGWLAALAASYNCVHIQNCVAVGGPVRNLLNDHWLYQLAAVQEQHRSNDVESPEFLDTANASYLRTVFFELGGFRQFLTFPGGEDTDLSLRCVMAGYTLHSTPCAIVWHAGRTSLSHLLRQCWLRGVSEGYIRVLHPAFRAFPPARKWSGVVHLWLNRLVATSDSVPLIIRPPIKGFIMTLRIALITLKEMHFFINVILPRQAVRYYAQHSRLQVGAYLVIDSLCYLLRWLGRVAGTFRCVVHETGWQCIGKDAAQ